jgi:hypothetical protein
MQLLRVAGIIRTSSLESPPLQGCLLVLVFLAGKIRDDAPTALVSPLEIDG